MTARSAMTPRKCYSILGLKPGASQDEIKSSFRRMAFKLHPDLNPSPDAARKFRELNEAYVFLSQQPQAKKQAPKPPPKPKPSGKPKAGPATGASAYARQQQSARSHTYSANNTFHYKEEEVLRDILKDEFARQVFEDIYRQVKKGSRYVPQKTRKRELSLKWGKRSLSIDLSKGLTGSIKSWIRRQLDYEQTIHFPAQNLIPGRTVPITVYRRFAKAPIKIDLTIPANFTMGKVIRVKGLGRRLGPWKGDLFLKIQAR